MCVGKNAPWRGGHNRVLPHNLWNPQARVRMMRLGNVPIHNGRNGTFVYLPQLYGLVWANQSARIEENNSIQRTICR